MKNYMKYIGVSLLFLGMSIDAWSAKITDYTNIVSGKKYYIGATTSTTDYYLSVSGDGKTAAESVAGTAVTDKSNATVFTFTGSGTSWTIQYESGNYLSLKSTNDNGKVQVVTSSSTFTASNVSPLIRLTINSHAVQKNNSTANFGSYASTQTDIWLEEVTCYTVNWSVNNGAASGSPSTNVAENHKVTTLPTAPSSSNCDNSKVFVGWSASPIVGETNTRPTDLFFDASQAPPVTDNVTYYAVFAAEEGKSTLLSEDFSSASLGDNTTTTGQTTSWDGNSNITSTSTVYQAGGAVRLASSTYVGYFITKSLTAAVGTVLTISFDVKGWTTVEGNGVIEVSGNSDKFTAITDLAYSATMSNSFERKQVSVVLTSANPAIKIYSYDRAFIDNLLITAASYSNYVTTCCDNMVDAPTVTGTSTKNSIILSWTNVADATGYIVACSGGTPGSVNSSGTSRSCTITGLSPNTTYTWSVVATYEDPYCGATPANGNTTTSQVYAVTYDANGGTVTTLPSAASYAVGETVTVAAKPATTVKDGYNFTGWNTSDDGTGDHYESSGSATFIMPSSAVTLYAEWTAKTYEKYVFSCVDISVASADAGKALVTSRNGINVMATNPIKVTVSGAVAGHRVTFTNSVGLKFYKKVEGTGDDAGKYKYVEAIDANSFVTPLTNQEVYVSYNPTSDGTGTVLSALPFTISCDGVSQEFNTSGDYVKARNLPDAVAIVANVGGSWHGLSANITSSSTPKDQMIAVATTDGILKAYGPANSFGYKLWPVRTVNSSYDRSGYTYTTGYPAKIFGDRLRFAGKDSKGLMANNNESSNKYNINNNGTITAVTADFEHDENYEWKVTTREINGQFVYTLQSDQAYNNRHLRLWNGRWGTYLDEKGTEDLYILPLVETALVDMQPFEWGTDQVVVYYTPGATPVALTGVNLGSSAAASPTFVQIGSSDLWRVSGLTGMTSKPAQQLQVMITENGAAKQGLLQIPLIVSGNSTEAELRASLTGADATEKNKVAKNTDVVILNGGKLTTGTNSGNFKDLYIYAGGKAIITNTMSFGDMYMRGGFGYIGDERWDVPRAKIDAAIDLSGKLYYDLTMDGTKYYDLAVPYEVNLTEATDDKGDGDFNVWMKVYDGTLRANTGKGWTWYDWSGDLLLHPGTGYLIEATPRYNRSYCTVRFPMTPDLSSGEAAKDPFAVTAPGMNADGTIATGKTPNNVGWNFVANPYMCNFGSNEMSGSADDVLQVGELSENEETHKYEWDTEGAKNVRYVTIFNYNTQEYSQQAWSSTVLAPFTGFFVQIAKAGAINFATAGRQLSAPAILRATKLPSDMEIVITASGNGQSDETRLHINNELTLAYALEFPDEMTKQMNVGALNFYTISNNTNMYANGMSYADAQEWVPIGIDIPEEGLFTFSVGEVNENYIKSVLIVDKNSGLEYDLTSISPQLMLDAGIFDARFAVKIVLRDEGEIPTGIADLNAGGDTPKKFIYQDKMYIMRNGILYDATGKRVRLINQ